MAPFAKFAVVEEAYAADAARMLEEMRAEEALANPDGMVVGHQCRVAMLSRGIARASGMDREGIELVTLAARYHDIGKLDVDPAILNKKGRFTPEERLAVSMHSELGARRLESIPGISKVMVDAARYHHERYDGEGTCRLAAEEIPEVARILAIADVYDAMVSERVYKPGHPADETLLLMTSPAEYPDLGAAAFDPRLLRAFVRLRLDDPAFVASDGNRAALEEFAASPLPDARDLPRPA